MTVIFTEHAKNQLTERRLSKAFVLTVIRNPSLVKKQKDERLQFIKRFKQTGKIFLLICIVEKSVDILKVITVFKTSKVKKYL